MRTGPSETAVKVLKDSPDINDVAFGAGLEEGGKDNKILKGNGNI